MVDGHSRYRICRENNIEFKIAEKEFDNIEDVKIWVIHNQFGRRNLSAYDRSVLALKLEDIFKEMAKKKQSEGGGAVPKISSEAPMETREKLAKAARVSFDTINKVKLIEEKATEEQKQSIRDNEASINQVFKQIKSEARKKERQYNRGIVIPDKCKG